MTDGTKPAVVTRRELYPILGSVYLLIAFALIGNFRSDDSALRGAGYFLIFCVAAGTSVFFTVQGARERKRETGGQKGPANQGDSGAGPADGA